MLARNFCRQQVEPPDANSAARGVWFTGAGMAQHGADKYRISASAEPGLDPAQALLDICPWLGRINFQNQGSDKDRPGVSVLQIYMA